jgi:hypothetical protein
MLVLPGLSGLVDHLRERHLRGGALLRLLADRCCTGVLPLQQCLRRLLWHCHQVRTRVPCMRCLRERGLPLQQCLRACCGTVIRYARVYHAVSEGERAAAAAVSPAPAVALPSGAHACTMRCLREPTTQGCRCSSVSGACCGTVIRCARVYHAVSEGERAAAAAGPPAPAVALSSGTHACTMRCLREPREGCRCSSPPPSAV